jgi:signal transduction histidine kinase
VRRRIVALTAAVAAVAVLVLGVPLVVLGRNASHNDAVARVDREAEQVASGISDGLDAREPITRDELANLKCDACYVVVTDTLDRVTRAGTPPRKDVITSTVSPTKGSTVTVKVNGARVGYRGTRIALAVAIFGVISVAAAAGVGFLLARRVTAPLDELAEASTRLGGGDFSVTVPRHGIPETDAVADALEASAARIDALVQAERDFSSNASHQLRSPLTALRMRLEELAENRDPDETHAEAEAALEQADRLDQTITELLALARRGRVGDTTDVDLPALAAARADTWRPAFTRARRNIRVDGVDGVHVRAHPGGVGQALDAVIDNALRHGVGNVVLSVRTRPSDVELVIADEGPGVPAAVAATAFDRHVSTSGGTGVGLALARTLVEADGGLVEVLPGAPTRFRFRFPVPLA